MAVAAPRLILLLSLCCAAQQELEEAVAALQGDDECALTGDDCALAALQKRASSSSAGRESPSWRWSRRRRSPTPAPIAPDVEQANCAPLRASENHGCASSVLWAFRSGKHNWKARRWYGDMRRVAGVGYDSATLEDFQRLFFCRPPGGSRKRCAAAPCGCSFPPCGCEQPLIPRDIPPLLPLEYSGMAWPSLKVAGRCPAHVFAIGDWGGLDGSLNTSQGRPPLVLYLNGRRKGPSVLPHERWDRAHRRLLCNHDDFVLCFNSEEACNEKCGFVKSVDAKPQLLVARALRKRAREKRPEFVLNVGDNFYWGGIESDCGSQAMHELGWAARHQFTQVFEDVYYGTGLDGIPWLGVLGNHDWGGHRFDNGWDQEIAYTWKSKRWVLPAPYWSTKADFVDQGFSVEMFFVDTNHLDARDHHSGDEEHNLCGTKNGAHASCKAVGGPSSVYSCKSWFRGKWREQQSWLREAMSASRARWQLVVTHFPCDDRGVSGFWAEMKEKGMDLIVTGHRHDQELKPATSRFATCIVTGGGGGITSAASPDPSRREDWYGEAQYGFYDLTISKESIYVESVNWDGEVVKTHTIHPS